MLKITVICKGRLARGDRGYNQASDGGYSFVLIECRLPTYVKLW